MIKLHWLRISCRQQSTSPVSHTVHQRTPIPQCAPNQNPGKRVPNPVGKVRHSNPPTVQAEETTLKCWLKGGKKKQSILPFDIILSPKDGMITTRNRMVRASGMTHELGMQLGGDRVRTSHFSNVLHMWLSFSISNVPFPLWGTGDKHDLDSQSLRTGSDWDNKRTRGSWGIFIPA